MHSQCGAPLLCFYGLDVEAELHHVSHATYRYGAHQSVQTGHTPTRHYEPRQNVSKQGYITVNLTLSSQGLVLTLDTLLIDAKM